MTRKTKQAFNRIRLFFGMTVLVLSLFVLPVAAEEQTEENTSAASDSVSAEEESYWQHVKDVQKEIRMMDGLQYGMVPIYGQYIADGTYDIKAESNSTYFKIAKAVLHVKDGVMTAEITIPSMSYLKVYMGTAAEAKKANESELIGFQEVDNQTVFTIPVEALNAELDCAALSKNRDRWYDRKLVFYAASLPEEALLIQLPDYDLIEDAIAAYGAEEAAAAESISDQEEQAGETGSENDPEYLLSGTPEAVAVDLPDGEYSIEVNMVGGSGRASISSPTLLTVRDGKAYAKLLWSSAYYDYMAIGDETYENLTTDGGNSSFEIPVVYLDRSFPVIADTTAMGDPVEIRYELTFYSESIGPKGRIPQEAAKKVLIIAVIILAVGAVLNFVLKRKKKK